MTPANNDARGHRGWCAERKLERHGRAVETLRGGALVPSSVTRGRSDHVDAGRKAGVIDPGHQAASLLARRQGPPDAGALSAEFDLPARQAGDLVSDRRGHQCGVARRGVLEPDRGWLWVIAQGHRHRGIRGFLVAGCVLEPDAELPFTGPRHSDVGQARCFARATLCATSARSDRAESEMARHDRCSVRLRLDRPTSNPKSFAFRHASPPSIDGATAPGALWSILTVAGSELPRLPAASSAWRTSRLGALRERRAIDNDRT